MHSCPICGMACDCSGDWDDFEVMTPEWVNKNCKCECEQMINSEYDYEEDAFTPCMDCDLPDSCQDYGCAKKAGFRRLNDGTQIDWD